MKISMGKRQRMLHWAHSVHLYIVVYHTICVARHQLVPFFPMPRVSISTHILHTWIHITHSQCAHAVRERKNVHSTPCVIKLDGGSRERSTELDGIWRNVQEANPHGASHNYMCILRVANHSFTAKKIGIELGSR